MKQVAVLCLATTLALNPISASAALLQRGSQNKEVQKVQVILKQMGYFNYPKSTGYYGSITENAVKHFQKKYGLIADGIVGNKTKQILFKNNQKEETTTKFVQQSKNGALDWFKEVQYIWQKQTNATVTDIDTGRMFHVKRTFGYNHADVEPLTKEDSAIIKDIWNGWSWERRAVVVQVGDSILAGSMTAMPHAGVDSAPVESVVNNRSCDYGTGENLDAVKNNGASGVMDIHFLNSRTHGSNQLQKSQQDMVLKASKYIEENK